MKTGNVVLGLIAGIATGTILGILFAPEKGSATRRKISGKCSEYADGVKDKINEMDDALNNKIEDVKHSGNEMMATAKNKFEDIKTELKS